MKPFRLPRLALVAAIVLASAHFAAASPTPMLSISVNPTSILTTETATVTATILPNTGLVNCGKGQIQYELNHSGLWTQLANNLVPVANQFSAPFDATAFAVIAGDVVTFRAGYESSGQGCDAAGTAIGQSPTVDLLITGAPPCPEGIVGAYITIGNAAGNGTPAPGYTGEWSFDVNVTACQDIYDVTAQGGANGWAGVKNFNTTVGSVTQSVKNKNTVYLWNIGDMLMGETKTLTITVGATIKNGPSECGRVKLLNGAWSSMYAVVDGGAKTKSDYTTYTSTITVTCP